MILKNILNKVNSFLCLMQTFRCIIWQFTTKFPFVDSLRKVFREGQNTKTFPTVENYGKTFSEGAWNEVAIIYFTLYLSSINYETKYVTYAIDNFRNGWPFAFPCGHPRDSTLILEIVTKQTKEGSNSRRATKARRYRRTGTGKGHQKTLSGRNGSTRFSQTDDYCRKISRPVSWHVFIWNNRHRELRHHNTNLTTRNNLFTLSRITRSNMYRFLGIICIVSIIPYVTIVNQTIRFDSTQRQTSFMAICFCFIVYVMNRV